MTARPRRFMPPEHGVAASRPRVYVQTIVPSLAENDLGLTAALSMHAGAYRIASMRWLDSGAVRVVWERR